jgi:SAM-dependent methyltransferase
MMFGTRDEFDYLECGKCGTIQIVEIPDLGQYYPSDYYSLESEIQIEIATKLKRRVAARLASKYLRTGSGMLGKFITGQWPYVVCDFPKWLRIPSLTIGYRSKILDVGCGTGRLLRTMHVFGYRDLTGADVFIREDIHHPDGVNVYKRSVAELEPDYDLIMLHHSFEHMPDPVAELRGIHRLLKNDGICLIRIPLANHAWEKYGVNWVQLDPPRHLFLYTENSFRQMAESCGFAIVDIVYDSDEFQFYGSEQYLRDIPLSDPRAYRGNISESIFTGEQLHAWTSEAEELNAQKRGDQACFLLKRANSSS